MGWRDLLVEEEPKKLPEMTTIYDPQTQSIQLILWSDYIGKGYQVRRKRMSGVSATGGSARDVKGYHGRR